MKTVEDLIEAVKTRMAASDFCAVVAFDITDKNETITIDSEDKPVKQSNEKDPKVTLSATFDTFAGYLKKKPNQLTLMTHMGSGKLNIRGSSGTAMAFLSKVL